MFQLSFQKAKGKKKISGCLGVEAGPGQSPGEAPGGEAPGGETPGSLALSFDNLLLQLKIIACFNQT